MRATNLPEKGRWKIFLHGFDKMFVNEYHTSKQRSSRLINEHMALVNRSKRLWSEILFALILIKQGLNKAVNFTCKSKKSRNMCINISSFSYELIFTTSDLHKSASIFWSFSFTTTSILRNYTTLSRLSIWVHGKLNI